MKWLTGLKENLGTKVMALVFATLLYAHVATERPDERVVAFPVVFEGLPDSIALAMPPPERVSAVVRGTRKQTIRMRIAPPTVSLNLAGVGPGRYQRALTIADFQVVSEEGLDVVRPVQPTTLDLRLEARATESVPVVVVVRGEPLRGFVAGPAQAHPSEARLSGPESWVREQETLYTEPLALTGRRDSQELVHPLAELPPWATVSPGSVLVRVPIRAEAVGEVVLTPKVVGLRSGFRARLDPPTIRLRWSGPRAAAGEPPRDLAAEVDVNLRGRGRYLLPVRLIGRAASQASRVVPESVAVVVQ